VEAGDHYILSWGHVSVIELVLRCINSGCVDCSPDAEQEFPFRTPQLSGVSKEKIGKKC